MKSRGWQRHAARFPGHACGALVAARTGTASASLRTEATTDLRGAPALAAGVRSRATGRRLDVDKATVNHGLPGVGPHGQHVRHDCCRHLPLHDGQWDALWTCISKKAAHLTPLEQRAAVDGDA